MTEFKVGDEVALDWDPYADRGTVVRMTKTHYIVCIGRPGSGGAVRRYRRKDNYSVGTGMWEGRILRAWTDEDNERLKRDSLSRYIRGFPLAALTTDELMAVRDLLVRSGNINKGENS